MQVNAYKQVWKIWFLFDLWQFRQFNRSRSHASLNQYHKKLIHTFKSMTTMSFGNIPVAEDFCNIKWNFVKPCDFMGCGYCYVVIENASRVVNFSLILINILCKTLISFQWPSYTDTLSYFINIPSNLYYFLYYAFLYILKRPRWETQTNHEIRCKERLSSERCWLWSKRTAATFHCEEEPT